MTVTLKHYTPLNIAVEAALVCTASLDKAATKDPKQFLTGLLKAGHESIFEHINYTFYIQNITRGLLQELARHRHCSMSVESTRWALHKVVNKVEGFPTRLGKMYDESLENMPDDKEKLIWNAHKASLHLQDAINQMVRAGIPNDVVKPYLQECFYTNLYFTTNARELRHIIALRSAPNVYPEFRLLAFNLKCAVPADHRFMYFDREE